MIRRVFIAAAVPLLFFAAPGCTSGGQPSERALEESSATILSGIDAGIDAVDSQEVVAVRARYNPCVCPAPDFEIHLRGEWIRVIKNGDQTRLEGLRDQAQTLADLPGLHHVWLEGQFDGNAVFDDTGVEYQRFEVQNFRLDE